jgi:class 3 adenylate cyclase
MPNLPSGTVTFLFSDIEGSTSLLKQLGDEQFTQLLGTHRRLVRETFALYHGQEIDTQGDAFFYSFPRAREAVAAAAEVQRKHHEQAWPQGVSVRMRLGLHTGEPAIGEEGYTGLDVVRASRIAAVGRGGQVLLSDTTRAIVAGDLPEGVRLRSLGDQRLKDIDQPEPLHELDIDGVPVSPESAALVEAGTTVEHGESFLPAETLAAMPDWLRDVAGRMTPLAGRAGQLIEQRVMAEIKSSMREEAEREASERGAAEKGEKAKPSASGPASRPSMADEIAKLRKLRDDGAITEEQYARALDRTISG